MPDQTPNTEPVRQENTNVSLDSSQPAPQAGPTIHIGDEFGTAKRNLPPVKVLLLATAGILIVVGIFSFLHRAKPQGAGSLDNVTAVDLPGQNAVLVALTFTLQNSGEKPLWVHGIAGRLANLHSARRLSDLMPGRQIDPG